ncbi:MAG: hypothetical protein WCZ90_01700 [Melioribacteraceae bacterium]
MRRTIGVLGIALPLVVVIGGLIENPHMLQGSISGYYYTNMRDFFVGILCVVALFLISYQGYERIDNIVANLAGFSALGMIIFPTKMYYHKIEKVGMFLMGDDISGFLHLLFASIFFITLSYNSIFLFTKRHSINISKEKRSRNILYRVSGIVMLIQILLIILYMVFLRETYLSKTYPILIFESIALFAFGISWLVKGNTFFRDQIKNVDEMDT